jgi:integrase
MSIDWKINGARFISEKNGERTFELRYNYQGKQLTQRVKVPDSWSRKPTERYITEKRVEFVAECKAGNILTRQQKRQKAEQEAAEQAKIKTLQQYAEQVYFPQTAVRDAKSTVSSYKWTLKKYVFPVLGNIPLREITAAQISAILLDQQKQGKVNSSVVRLYQILNSLFKSALMDDTIVVNPMNKVGRPKARKDEVKSTEPESFTEEEIVYILGCLKKEPLKWQVYTSLLIETGVRRGEACALQWRDIDEKNKVITVTHSIGYTPEDGVYMDTTKGKNVKEIPISAELASLLRSLRSSQKVLSVWVFPMPNDPSRSMRPDSATKYFANLGKKYGIQDLHPHKLRHSFASIALTNGADVVTVSKLLGHADVSTTLRFYSHTSDEKRRRAAEIFQNALNEKKA